MQVREVDARDEDAFAQWHAVATAVRRELRPDGVHPGLQEARAAALAGRPDRDPPTSELIEHVVAVDGDDVVGAAVLELPLRDNTHVAYVELGVLPAARRRGVATALLHALEQRSRGIGRTLLMTELDEPPDGTGAAGRAFFEAVGLRCALEEVRRELALPVPEERLAELERSAAARAVDYEVVSWSGRCPDELVDGRAELGRAMSTDAPLGDLDWHEEVWDAARVRERERVIAEQGRTCVVAAARHRPSGRLVAFTELAARPAEPAQVDQWETLVLREHRGHRLGQLVKVAALRRLAAEVPGAQRVVTTNAVTNTWMVSVNEALGFAPAGMLTSWQRPL